MFLGHFNLGHMLWLPFSSFCQASGWIFRTTPLNRIGALHLNLLASCRDLKVLDLVQVRTLGGPVQNCPNSGLIPSPLLVVCSTTSVINRNPREEAAKQFWLMQLFYSTKMYHLSVLNDFGHISRKVMLELKWIVKLRSAMTHMIFTSVCNLSSATPPYGEEDTGILLST